jgi:hypothetical protein
MKKNITEGTFYGRDSVLDLKRSKEYSKLNSIAKKDAEAELIRGGSVTLEKKGKDLDGDGDIDSEDYLAARDRAIKKAKSTNESALSKIQSLKSGDKVQYLGASYEVIENDGFTLELKSNEGKDIKVNYNMFQQKGNIPENYSFGLQKSPQKYQGPDEVDYEGEMAKSELLKMKKYAIALCNMIDDETQLEAWVQAKLTKASDYMSAVYHYLDYQRSNQ